MRRISWNLGRLAAAGVFALALSGCELMWYDHDSNTHATTPLVQFLYGKDAVPVTDASVELKLPIRVGLSFLPSQDTRATAIPTAAQRAEILQAIREKFRALPYVTEIVIVPDYYLDGRRGNGFEQMQQLSRMYHLDLYALASYDIVASNVTNKSSFTYLTIVGAFFVHGNDQEIQSMVDLAVIEPQNRQLVLRAGGVSYVKGKSAAVDLEKHENWRVQRGFEEAGAALMVNFETELRGFEARVREGTAPIKVVRQAKNGGGGALDPLWLGLLAVLLIYAVSRRYWDSRVARNVIFGQRSIVSSRFTRDGAR
jgi:rhombotail lipoprotein